MDGQNQNTNGNATGNGADNAGVQQHQIVDGQQQVVVQQAQQAPHGNVHQVQQPTTVEVPMFTQDQVNSIVSGRVGNLNTRIAELSSQLETSKADAESYKTKYEALVQKTELSKLGIPESCHEYILFEVQKLMSNGKPFAENMAEYVKANESFINTIKANENNANNGNSGNANNAGQGNQQSTLLQQLANNGGNNTNGAGNNHSVSNADMSGIDVDKILAAHGIKRRK